MIKGIKLHILCFREWKQRQETDNETNSHISGCKDQIYERVWIPQITIFTQWEFCYERHGKII